MLLANGRLKTTYRQEVALVSTRARWVALAIGVPLFALLPFFLRSPQLHLANLMLIGIIGAVGLNILIGLAGQISLGHAGFMALGAFSSGIVIHELGWPYLATLPVVVLTSAGFGLVVGLPALRLRGLYLALATLAFHFIIIFALSEYQSHRLAAEGLRIPPPDFGLFQINSLFRWYYLLGAVAAVVVAGGANLRRSRTAREWIAVRDRDLVGRALGVNVGWMKLKAFVLASVLAGLSGSLFAAYLRVVSVEGFTLFVAIEYIAIVIIGGLGSVAGAVLGAIFLPLLRESITWGFDLIGAGARRQQQLIPLQLSMFGLTMLAFLIFEPRGLMGLWRRVRDYIDLWPLRHRGGR